MIGFIASSLLATDMYFRIQEEFCWKSGAGIVYSYCSYSKEELITLFYVPISFTLERCNILDSILYRSSIIVHPISTSEIRRSYAIYFNNHVGEHALSYHSLNVISQKHAIASISQRIHQPFVT